MSEHHHYSASSVGERLERSPKREFDKTANRKRWPSPFRDARFLRDLEILSSKPAVAGTGTTSVCYPYRPISTSLPKTPLAGSKKVRAPSSPPSTPSRKPAGKPLTRMAPWWHSSYSANPAGSYRVPAQWRDASDLLRLLYAHRALAASGGRVFTINLRLRDDIEALARSKPAPLTWLQKRVNLELQKALGRPVSFLLTLEEDDHFPRRLHLHGEFALLPEEMATRRKMMESLVRVRKALRRAAGEWPKEMPRQHQCKLAADPDEGWACYIGKTFWKATPFMRRLLGSARGSLRLTFDGPVLSVTHALGKRARALNRADRWRVMRETSRK